MKSYHEAFLKLIEENKNTIAKKLEKDPDFIQSIMNFAIKNSSKILFRDLDKDKKNMLDEFFSRPKYCLAFLYITSICQRLA